MVSAAYVPIIIMYETEGRLLLIIYKTKGRLLLIINI